MPNPLFRSVAVEMTRRGTNYNPTWKNDPLLGPWISEDPKDPKRVICTICKVSYRVRKDNLQRHGREIHGLGRSAHSSKPLVHKNVVLNSDPDDSLTNNICMLRRDGIPGCDEMHVSTVANITNIETSGLDPSVQNNNALVPLQENDETRRDLRSILDLDASLSDVIRMETQAASLDLNDTTTNPISYMTNIHQNREEELGDNDVGVNGEDVNMSVRGDDLVRSMHENEVVVDNIELTPNVGILPGDSIRMGRHETGVELDEFSNTLMSSCTTNMDHDAAEEPENEESAESIGTNNRSSSGLHERRLSVWREKYSWIEPEPIFLVDSEGNYRSTKLKCSLCQSLHTPQTSALKAHEKTLKHCRKTGNWKDAEKFDEEKAKAEIELAALMISRGLSFNFAEYMTPRLRKTFSDSQIAEKQSLHRKKVQKIAHNVILPCHLNRVADSVRGRKYIILLDGYTDQHNQEHVCICLRYYDSQAARIVEILFDIISVFDGDENQAANSDTLTGKIVAPFFKHNIPLKDCLGLETDGAAVYRGAHESVLQKIRLYNELIEGWLCFCHVLHLVGRHSMPMSEDFEQIPHLLYMYFRRSPKKDSRRLVLQLKLESEVLKMINPTIIRWLSFFASNLRVSSCWTMLETFFEKECKNPLTTNSDALVLEKYFRDPLSKAQHFMNLQVFSKLYVVEKKLQTEDYLYTSGRRLIRELYIVLLLMFMPREYVMTRPLELVNPASKAHMKPASQLSLDPLVTKALLQVTKAESDKFKETNRDFLSIMCVKFRERYDFSQDYMLHMKFLEPALALDPEFHTGEYNTLQCVYDNLPGLTNNRDEGLIDRINDEWQRLPVIAQELPPEQLLEVQVPVTFWHQLTLVRDDDGRKIFSALGDFALNCLTLPNSNAKSERVWSSFTWQVRSLRAPLYNESKRSILLSQEYIKFDGGPVNFQVTDEMLSNYFIHLNDPVKDERNFQDPDTYMGDYITDELKEKCKADNQFAKDLGKKLKEIISSTNPSLDFTLGDCLELDLETAEGMDDSSSVHDPTATSVEELDNFVPPTHTPASNHAPEPLVHQRERNVERYSHFLPNRRFAEHTYYFTAIPVLPVRNPPMYKNYQVCHIDRNVHDGQDQRICVDWLDYQTMRPGLWESGRIIDAVTAINERNWEEATFISTDLTESFFAEWDQDPKVDEWPLFHLQYPETGKIFFPFLKDGNHWVLFTIDMDASSAFFLDPKRRTPESLWADEVRCMQALTRFIGLCRKYRINNSIAREDSFRLSRPDYSNRAYQNDDFSCADFIINKMDVIARNARFDRMFKPQPYRVSNAKALIRESRPMMNGCIFCYGDFDDGEISDSCEACGQFYHFACATDVGILSEIHCPLCLAAQRRRRSI
ncbi:hypothetical protein QAD02_018882 [Eretmocerus hayati]|uniref:Uncharacterized protein n=1 Tax=Eretmocerus hayati TaxID=131215 RepID=A0ACC2PI34_9HYME|nr:hypothetical protein QAD02_018882 [Eretmocerus hayati]